MSILVEVEMLDGSFEIMTLAEAETARANGELAPAVPDGKALTITEVYGSGYQSSS